MIKNIIFDFGGVIYDINHDLSKKAFKDLGIKDFDQLYSHKIQSELFEKLERGEINNDEFYHILKQSLPKNTSSTQIRKAWNALLVGFDINKIELLKRLKKNYSLFLLSNTNSIHQEHFINELNRYEDFNKLFNDTWYSHEKKMRKPEFRIYQSLIKEHQLTPNETLFIDDLNENIKAAKELGLQTYYIKNNDSILSLFNENGFYKRS